LSLHSIMPIPRYKDIVDLLKKGATVEAQEQIMALREAALELQEENLELRQRVKELEENASLRRSLVFRDGMYWRETESGSDGPFCPPCYDNNNKLVRLQYQKGYMSARGDYKARPYYRCTVNDCNFHNRA